MATAAMKLKARGAAKRHISNPLASKEYGVVCLHVYSHILSVGQVGDVQGMWVGVEKARRGRAQGGGGERREGGGSKAMREGGLRGGWRRRGLRRLASPHSRQVLCSNQLKDSAPGVKVMSAKNYASSCSGFRRTGEQVMSRLAMYR